MNDRKTQRQKALDAIMGIGIKLYLTTYCRRCKAEVKKAHAPKLVFPSMEEAIRILQAVEEADN